MPTTTLLFVDQVGSTAQLDALGDVRAGRLRQLLLDQLRAAVRQCAGREVEFTGDGLFAAFGGTTDAVDAAALMQRAVTDANHARPDEERVALRIGINAGEPTVESDGRMFGLSVVIARRLCDHAGAGETLVSDVVRALAAPQRPGWFRELGFVELKGVSEPARVWALVTGSAGDLGPAPAGSGPVAVTGPVRPDQARIERSRAPTTIQTAVDPPGPSAVDQLPTTRLAPPVGRLDLPGGGSLPLGQTPCVIGRGAGASVVVDDTNVSRRHAEIRLVGAHLVVRDLGSTNGTKVNGVPVLERVLVDGDEITIGIGRFRVALIEG